MPGTVLNALHGLPAVPIRLSEREQRHGDGRSFAQVVELLKGRGIQADVSEGGIIQFQTQGCLMPKPTLAPPQLTVSVGAWRVQATLGFVMAIPVDVTKALVATLGFWQLPRANLRQNHRAENVCVGKCVGASFPWVRLIHAPGLFLNVHYLSFASFG